MRILHWFRKDLRLDDNTALSEAVHDAQGDVVPYYASDPAILGRDDMASARVRFVLGSLAVLRDDIAALGTRRDGRRPAARARGQLGLRRSRRTRA